jgi:hypothetical protein
MIAIEDLQYGDFHDTALNTRWSPVNIGRKWKISKLYIIDSSYIDP